MELRKVLEALVEVVATLGKLAATVTVPRKSSWPLLYPESLHTALREFIWSLRDTLDHGDITSLRQRGVTPLSQALATLRDTPGATWADVRAAARAWWELMDAQYGNWNQLWWEAWEILNTLKGEATNEDTAKATATSLAGDLRDETPPRSGTAGDSLVAAARQPSVPLASVVAPHDAPVVVATKAREEAAVATRQAGLATLRGQRVKEALGLLGRLRVACERAWGFPWELHDQLRHIEDTWEETEEVSPDDLKAVVAEVAEFERLWEASARLTREHLLVALGEIDFLLSSPCGGSGGPGGRRGCVVAELCQRAKEDIPRLLEISGVTDVTSSGQ